MERLLNILSVLFFLVLFLLLIGFLSTEIQHTIFSDERKNQKTDSTESENLIDRLLIE